MFRLFCFSALATGAMAQREPTMSELEDASKAFKDAGQAYLAASNEGSSFLQAKKGFLQPLVARVMVPILNLLGSWTARRKVR